MATAPWHAGKLVAQAGERSLVCADRVIPGSPAFTPVSARRTLTRAAPQPPAAHPPQPQPQASAPAPVKIEWPQPVRDYVSRAFVGADDIAHSDIAAKLRSVITQAAENNQLDTIDWPNHPLPQDLFRHE